MNKTALVGGSAKFEEFIRLAGVDYERVTLERAIGDGAFTSMILLPDYDNGKSTVDIIDDLDLLELLAKRKYDGFKVYSENYFSVGNYNASLFGYDVVCDACHTHKQTLCAVNGLQNYLGDGRILQASERVEALIREVGNDNYGWLVDMGNFLCVDEDPKHAVSIAAPYAFHVHAKDFLFKDGSLPRPQGFFGTAGGNHIRGTVVGHGVVPVLSCMRILKEKGYDGWLSLEFEGAEDTEFALKAGLHFLKNAQV